MPDRQANNNNARNFSTQSAEQQGANIQQYYRFQSKIYDLTRWTFLFGRRELVRDFPLSKEGAHYILEVGCGTGSNLALLARRFPNAQLIGMDVSGDMLNIAQKKLQPIKDRLELIERPYGAMEEAFSGQLDGVLFSYALTMINPQYAQLIERAWRDLKPGGMIGVTDFHNSRFQWFKNHMSNHHVRMDSHLPPALEKHFKTIKNEAKPAYFGVWQYLIYFGRKAT